MDHGPWTMDYGLWTMDHGPSTIVGTASARYQEKRPFDTRWGVRNGAINEIHVQTQYLCDWKVGIDHHGCGPYWPRLSGGRIGHSGSWVQGDRARGERMVSGHRRGEGSSHRSEPTKHRLGGRHDILVEDAVTINRPIDEVYAYGAVSTTCRASWTISKKSL